MKTGVARSQRHKPIRSLGMQIGVQPGPLWGPWSLRLGPGRAVGCLPGAAQCRSVPSASGAKELVGVGGEHRLITLSPGARGARKAALVAQTCGPQVPVEGMQGGEMGGRERTGVPQVWA